MDVLPAVPHTVKVKLGFDPAKSEDENIRSIFSDRIARNLWLGIRWRHITSQYFNADCLKIARQVRKRPPATGDDLASILRGYGQDPVFSIRYKDAQELAEALLPYVRGDLDFRYEITEQK